MSEQLTQKPASNNGGGGNETLGRRVSFGKTTTLPSGGGGGSETNFSSPFGGTGGGMGITRERSFVRMPTMNAQQHQQQHASNKRRSLAFGHPHQHALQQQQMRGGGGGGKPALELYRPPNFFADGRQQSPLDNKLNVHAQEFQMARGDHLQNSRSSMALFQGNGNNGTGGLQHSKSNNNMQQQQQMQLIAARQLQLAKAQQQQQQQQQRASLVLQQQQQQQLQAALSGLGTPNAGNGLQTAARVKFAPDGGYQQHQQQHMTASLQHHQLQLQQQQQQQMQQQLHHAAAAGGNTNRYSAMDALAATPLQRSKSLSSAADAIARGIAGLGLGVVADTAEIGTFIPEIQALIDQAREDPNALNARALMELANHVMQRAVEGRRYALPTSRFCIAIIAKEHKETFLEALLNTCRQWYQERDKVLGTPPSIKNVARPRFTAFMAFLTEMFCQLKRRQLQLRTQCDGVPPPLVLLTLLSKCCEDCVRPPVRSLSEIECLFFVLTCIGRDLEQHLPQQLEALLASVRDAFLNASASAPAIRRTLLQLIELQASRWQLPGNTVLYYYPSNK